VIEMFPHSFYNRKEIIIKKCNTVIQKHKRNTYL